MGDRPRGTAQGRQRKGDSEEETAKGRKQKEDSAGETAYGRVILGETGMIITEGEGNNMNEIIVTIYMQWNPAPRLPA